MANVPRFCRLSERIDPNNLTEWEEAMGVLTPSNYYIALGITYQCENPDPDGEEHPDFAYVTELEVAG